MDAADIVLGLCALLNVGITAALAARFRHEVKAKARGEAKAKAAYSWICIAVGILSGVVFIGSAVLFDLSVGYGEILVAAPLFNLVLSGVLTVAGRIAIGWEPMRW